MEPAMRAANERPVPTGALDGTELAQVDRAHIPLPGDEPMRAGWSAPELACALCGAKHERLLVNEFWAGSFHAACLHTACEGCLRKWIQQDLPRCRAEGQLRVRCYAEGCRRMLPQPMVLQNCAAAILVATEIDLLIGNCSIHPALRDIQWDPFRDVAMQWLPTTCAVCQDYIGPTLQCDGCNCTACEGCMRRWFEDQIPEFVARKSMQLRCLAPDCKCDVTVTAVHVSPAVRKLQRQLRHRQQLQPLSPAEVQVDCPRPDCVGLACLNSLGWDTATCLICEHQWSVLDGSAPDSMIQWTTALRDIPTQMLPTTCTVCQDYVGPTLQCEGCAFTACACCMRRWCEDQIPDLVVRKCMQFRCFAPDCKCDVVATAVCVSPAVRELQRQLRRRQQLQSNPLYPAEVQVDCPCPDCVGLAYLGWDTAMCFICEHQWSVLEGSAPDDAFLLGELQLKQCPKCQVPIEKNGGCNHMTCNCGHEFYWNTLLPFR